jgi:large subunit ribosomal protein L15
MPLQRRLPKYGFLNVNRKEYKGINISTLQTLAEKKNISSIDIQVLIEAGLASKNEMVKILGKGELKTKIDVKAHAFSKSAVVAIESLKGTAEKI